jgi:hypothetical protein
MQKLAGSRLHHRRLRDDTRRGKKTQLEPWDARARHALACDTPLGSSAASTANPKTLHSKQYYVQYPDRL